MPSRTHLSPALMFAAAILLTACSKAPPPPVESKNEPVASAYRPSATFQELMDSIVDPAADQLWNSVSIISDASGTHEIKPTTPEQWHQLRRAAVTLIEAANLIAVPGRRVAAGSKTLEDGADLNVAAIQQRLESRHQELENFGAALRDIGGKLLTAIDKEDVEALTDHGGTLDTVCEACHRVFWYPEQPPIDAQ